MLAGIMCIGTMAGCGSDENQEGTGQEGTTVSSTADAGATDASDAGEEEPAYDLGGRTVTFAHWGSLEPSPQSQTYTQEIELIAMIEDKYNCVLQFNTTNDWSTYRQQVLLSAMSNEKYADVFWLGGGDMGLWTANNFLMQLDDYIDFSADHWNQELTDDWMIDGKHYFVTDADTVMGRVILFNKRLCEDNGITAESLYELQRNGEWTWDKLLEFAQQCTQIVNGEYVSYGLGAYGSCPVMPESFMISNGVAAAAYDENKNLVYNLEDPAVMEALQFSYDLVNTYHVCYSGATDWGTWSQVWEEGRTAFFMCDAWQMDMYYEPLAEDGFGVLMLPKGPSVDDYKNFMAIPAGIVMSSLQEDPEAIGALVDDYYRDYDWRLNLTTEEQYRDILDEGSIESIEMALEPGRTIIQAGDENSWYQGNILWSDFGILSQTPPRTWVTERRAEIEKAFEDGNVLPDREELEAEVNGEEAAE